MQQQSDWLGRVLVPGTEGAARRRDRFVVLASMLLLPAGLVVCIAAFGWGDGVAAGFGGVLSVVAGGTLASVRAGRGELGSAMVTATLFGGATAATVWSGTLGPLVGLGCVAVVMASVLYRGRVVAVLCAVQLAGIASTGVHPNPVSLTSGPVESVLWAVTVVVVGALASGMSGATREVLEQADGQTQQLRDTLADLEQTGFSRDFVEGVLNSLREFILVTDDKGLVLSANLAVYAVGGWEEVEVVGNSLRKVLTVEGDASRFHRADGTLVPVSVVNDRLPSRGGRDLRVWAATDITRQSHALEALRKANEHARDASLAKSNFLANMSHELRTPLNAIIGYGELLADEVSEPVVLEDLGRIQAAARSLLSLINGVLDLSKVEAGKVELNLAETELADVVAPVLDLVRPLAEAAGLGFRFQVPDETLYTDAVKLSAVLTNLLTNAIKFTSEGEIVLLIERWERSRLPWFRFTVQDTGRGMSSEAMSRMFEPFSQVHDGDESSLGGTGLGLSICQAYVDMMGGQLYCESTVGEGTTFVVEVPGAEFSALTPHTPTPLMPDAAVAHEHILVVDDDPTMLELISRVLARPGRQVICTPDPAQGLHWAERFRADVVLLDIAMPTMSGWAFMVRLQATRSADAPIVVISGDADEQVATALGAFGFMAKPVGNQELLDIVQRAVDS